MPEEKDAECCHCGAMHASFGLLPLCPKCTMAHHNALFTQAAQRERVAKAIKAKARPSSNVVRLCDAGVREHEYARTIIEGRKLPAGVDYETLLQHGTYDASRDVIAMTVKGAVFTFRVLRG